MISLGIVCAPVPLNVTVPVPFVKLPAAPAVNVPPTCKLPVVAVRLPAASMLRLPVTLNVRLFMFTDPPAWMVKSVIVVVAARIGKFGVVLGMIALSPAAGAPAGDQFEPVVQLVSSPTVPPTQVLSMASASPANTSKPTTNAKMVFFIGIIERKFKAEAAV